jgi:hypothetical protein
MRVFLKKERAEDWAHERNEANMGAGYEELEVE